MARRNGARADADGPHVTDDTLLSGAGAYRFLGISRAAWYRLVAESKGPPAVRVPGWRCPRYRVGTLRRWVEGREQKAG